MDRNYRDTMDQNKESPLLESIFKIKGWVTYLISKWFIIFLVSLIGGLFGALYSWLKEPVYTAETTFVLEEEGGNGGMMGQFGGLAGLAGIEVNAGGGLFQGDNILELYKSRTMIQNTLLSVADNSGNELLIDKFIQFNNLYKKIPLISQVDFKMEKPNRFRDSIIALIVQDINNNYLTVNRPNKKLSIISVKVISRDELFAKQFTDKIVGNVNTFYVETKTKKSLGNIAILQQKSDSVNAVMNGAIYASAADIDATPNLNPTRQVLQVPLERSRFRVETSKSILGELLRNLELSKMTLLKETPLIQIIDRPVLPLPKSKLSIQKATIVGGVLSGMLITLFLFSRYILLVALKNDRE